MSIKHHVREEILLAYAAGELDEATSLLVATHLALSPESRKVVDLAEEAAGVMLDDLAPASMAETAFADVMTRLKASGPAAELPRPRVPAGANPVLPEPLRSRIGGDADAIKWRTIGPGVKQMRLENVEGPSTIRFLKISGGTGVLEHGHTGEELTLVLSGAFRDGDEVFARGDVEFADGGVVHRPVAEPGEDCICLAVTSGPLKFYDLFGRIAQPFVGI